MRNLETRWASFYEICGQYEKSRVLRRKAERNTPVLSGATNGTIVSPDDAGAFIADYLPDYECSAPDVLASNGSEYDAAIIQGIIPVETIEQPGRLFGGWYKNQNGDTR